MPEVVEWTDPDAWDAFVSRAADATAAHLWGWRPVIEEAYGHKTYYLACADGGCLRGVLPLTLVAGSFSGPHLISIPFMDYAGTCVSGDAEAEALLLAHAQMLAANLGAGLGVRSLRSLRFSAPCAVDKVTSLLELGASETDLWRGISSEPRNRIRKGERSGLVAAVHGLEGLDDFYPVFSANMRDLGSPVHSRRFFSGILTHLREHAAIVVVRLDGLPIGAALICWFNGVVMAPWISALRRHFDKCPNQVLYWAIMRLGIERGLRVLDFGRSAPGSGTFAAKAQWGATTAQLYWYHAGGSMGGNAAPRRRRVLSWRRILGVPPHWPLHGARFSWPVSIWRHLPLPLANVLGPWLRRRMPS